MGKAYTEIAAGLEDAISHAKGDQSRARIHRDDHTGRTAKLSIVSPEPLQN